MVNMYQYYKYENEYVNLAQRAHEENHIFTGKNLLLYHVKHVLKVSPV